MEIRISQIEVLMRTALFYGFSQIEIHQLLDALRPSVSSFPRGTVLWHMGDDVKQAGLILKGTVEARKYGSDGSCTISAKHGLGELFGEVLMSSGNVSSPVEIIAVENLEVLFISLATLLHCCSGGAGILCTRLLKNLLSGISDKYWSLQERLQYLAYPSSQRRIAAFLINRAKLAGARQFSTGMSREALANYLGVNRSALSRTLSRMQCAGIIEFHRDSFEVCSIEQLEEVFM